MEGAALKAVDLRAQTRPVTGGTVQGSDSGGRWLAQSPGSFSAPLNRRALVKLSKILEASAQGSEVLHTWGLV